MRHRSPLLLLLLTALAAGSACHRQPEPRQYDLTGQVLAVRPDGTELTVRHHEIKGFMPAMTMPFRLKDPAQAKGRQVGDLVKAKLMVTDEESWLEEVQKTGWSPVAESPDTPRPSIEVLRPGDAVPDETFVDQDGKAFRLSSFRGMPVMITFIYTRCPIPDFCPRTDAWFGAVQRAARDGRFGGPVRLLSISFDPDYDTPAVLRAHAQQVGADRAWWTFATGPKATVEAWGARLGLSVIRNPADPNDITHNLRTAVLDRQGRLVTILDGNRWTPDQAIAALASVPAS